MLAAGLSDNCFRPEIAWDDYNIAGLDIRSATYNTDYDKVLIFLHGAGGSGADDAALINWLGDFSGLKVVFPTATVANDLNLWYETYVNGQPAYFETACEGECVYELVGLEESANAVAELIEFEKDLVGGNA